MLSINMRLQETTTMKSSLFQQLMLKYFLKFTILTLNMKSNVMDKHKMNSIIINPAEFAILNPSIIVVAITKKQTIINTK